MQSIDEIEGQRLTERYDECKERSDKARKMLDELEVYERKCLDDTYAARNELERYIQKKYFKRGK